MKQEIRDAWVQDLRENAPASMKGFEFGMNTANPCALARVLMLKGLDPKEHRLPVIFEDRESEFYLGIEASQIWSRSDTGYPPKCLATFIEEFVLVT